MPHYVILEHDWPHRHWDLMLEVDGVLRTWRLSAPPAIGHEVEAERIGDHRLAYLNYEGEVSGGRGRVSQWDQGNYTMIENVHRGSISHQIIPTRPFDSHKDDEGKGGQCPPCDAIQVIVVSVFGQKLNGVLTIDEANQCSFKAR